MRAALDPISGRPLNVGLPTRSRQRVGIVEMYIGRIEQFARADPNLLEVTTIDVELFLPERRSTLAAETRKPYRSALLAFYPWTHSTGRLDHNPASALRSVHVPATVPRIAADDAVQYTLRTAPPDKAAMIMFGRLACMRRRRSETTTLPIRRREGDVLRINGKDEKQRLVPVNDQLDVALVKLEHVQGAGYFSPGRYEGAQHTSTIGRKITTVLDRTALTPSCRRHRRMPVDRRSRSSELLVRHSSLATTERCLRVSMDAVGAAAAAEAFVTRMLDPHIDRIFRPGNEPSCGGRFAA